MEYFGACLFMAFAAQDYKVVHINNVIISGARLVDFGGALYCLQLRTLNDIGTEERSHRNIIVKNCYQYGNTSGMFCTVDGDSLQVIDNVNVPHNAFSYENIVYTLRQNLKT